MSVAAVKNVSFTCCGCRSVQCNCSHVDKGQTSNRPVPGAIPSISEKSLLKMYESSFKRNHIPKVAIMTSCDFTISDPKLRDFGDDEEDSSIRAKCCYGFAPSSLEEFKIFCGKEVGYKVIPDTNLNIESPEVSVHCSSSTEELSTSVVIRPASPRDKEASRESPPRHNLQVLESSCSALFEPLPGSLYSRFYSPFQRFNDVDGEDVLSYCKPALPSYEEKRNALVNTVDERCISLVLHARIPFVHDVLTEPVDDETVEDAVGKLLVKRQFVQSMEKLQDDQLPTIRRGNLPKESTAILKKWFQEHADHPYPSDEEKIAMSQATNVGISQISHWFINYRKRVWKPSMSSEGDVECTGGSSSELARTRSRKRRVQ